MKRMKLLATLLCAAILIGCAPKNITIEWDNSTCHFVTPGVYARITKVDNRHALVYNAGAPALIRFSDDKCESWSEPTEVAKAEILNIVSSEMSFSGKVQTIDSVADEANEYFESVLEQ